MTLLRTPRALADVAAVRAQIAAGGPGFAPPLTL